MPRRISVVFMFFFLMLGASRESHAFLEWLHKLSGPGPFIGARAEFRLDCTKRCQFLEWGLGGATGAIPEEWPAWTVSLSPSFARSIDNDLDYGRDVEGPTVSIFSFEPGVQFWHRKRMLFAGAGISFNRFTGDRFEDFSRTALALRAGKRLTCDGGSIRAVEIGAKYLFFEKHFRPEDFGARRGKRQEQGVVGVFAMVYF
jgi:hypothetical protein